MSLSRVMLSTLDAHSLYKQIGFARVPEPEKLMLLDMPSESPNLG